MKNKKIKCNVKSCKNINDDATNCTLDKIEISCDCNPCNCSNCEETICKSFIIKEDK